MDDVWTTGGGTLQYTVTGLTGGTQYDLQVRAVNAGGDGSWSATATGTPTAGTTCATGGAVTDASNTGLVSDCEVLLDVRDTLSGTGRTLNWSLSTPITNWDGVTVAGSPARVTGLSLATPVISHDDLTGTIPGEFGDLSNLTTLDLRDNGLTGAIPAELGDLSNLTGLYLSGNQLTGDIPEELGDLIGLTHLYLANDGLTGCIRSGLRNVRNSDLSNIGLPYCDVLLSGLSVSPGSLVPAFDPYRTEYSASVGLSLVTVTVAPANGHSATFQFFDDNDVVLADADNSLAGFQVEFGGEVAAVKIKVVSQDTQATHTYVVTDLGNRYDADNSGAIDRDEVISAVKDFFGGRITREEVIEIIKLFFIG